MPEEQQEMWQIVLNYLNILHMESKGSANEQIQNVTLTRETDRSMRGGVRPRWSVS